MAEHWAFYSLASFITAFGTTNHTLRARICLGNADMFTTLDSDAIRRWNFIASLLLLKKRSPPPAVG